MKLSDKQMLFSINLARLINHAAEIGIGVTLGEVYRTRDQQVLYYCGKTFNAKNELVKTQRLSKTMRSAHMKRLAADINVFVNGKYMAEKEHYKPLGDYWKTLHPDNVWGGDWGWDAPHFEMK